MRLDTLIRTRRLAVLALLWPVSIAAAQTTSAAPELSRPWFEAAVGAVFGTHTRVAQSPPEPISLGVVVALSGRISEKLSIVGEADVYSHGWTTLDLEPYREFVRGLMAGPRIYLPDGSRPGHIRIYGEELFGMAHRDLVGLSDSMTARRAIQAGAGLEWRLTRDQWAPSVRAAVSHRDAGNATLGLSEWRTTVTVAYRFGTLAPAPRAGSQAAGAPVRALSRPAAGRLEIAPAFTLHTPPDVNLPPRCRALALPCGFPRTFRSRHHVVRVGAGLERDVGGWRAQCVANAWRSSRGPIGRKSITFARRSAA
jgi:hypothetical protein